MQACLKRLIVFLGGCRREQVPTCQYLLGDVGTSVMFVLIRRVQIAREVGVLERGGSDSIPAAFRILLLLGLPLFQFVLLVY